MGDSMTRAQPQSPRTDSGGDKAGVRTSGCHFTSLIHTLSKVGPTCPAPRGPRGHYLPNCPTRQSTQDSPAVTEGLWDEGTMEASLSSSSRRPDLPSASPHIPLRLTTACPVSLEIPGRPHPPTKVRPPQSRPPPSLQKAANASEGWHIWLMTGKVLRRQVISTLSSSVGYFNTQYLCKRHNGTCQKLTLSQSSGTSRRG